MNTPISIKTVSVFLVLLVPVALAGCGTAGSLKKPREAGSSIVYGYIDMDDAPTSLQWITMKQLRPKTDKPYYHFYVDDGMFYIGDVPPGTYKFWEFGGLSGWRNIEYTFNFPSQGKGEMDRRITDQRVYFAGCYKYRKMKTGFFKPKQFDLEPINDASCEKEMLERLGKWTKAPEWKLLVDRRLTELQ